jgi:DNA transposition AAA+ family ATPase
MIDQNTKELIKCELNKRVAHIGSGKKAGVELGISNATISNMLNDKTELLSDDMWRKVAAILNCKLDERWVHVDTTPYLKLMGHFNDARLHGNSFGIICHPGSGKTHTLNQLSATQKISLL